MKKVLLFLANGFETYEASVFIDVFGWNNTEGNGDTRLITCGFTEVIKSAFGIQVLPDRHMDGIDVDEFDALAIPGGFEEYGFYKDGYNPLFSDLIRSFHSKSKFIASICVGALPVGKSGVLSGKKATTYPGRRQSQLKEFGAEVMNEPIVIENQIITSWNPATAIHVALKLLAVLTTEANAENIRKRMGFNKF